MHVRALRLSTLLEKRRKCQRGGLRCLPWALHQASQLLLGWQKDMAEALTPCVPVIRPGCLANLDAQTSIFNGLMVKLMKRTQKDPTPNRKSEITTQAVESSIRLQ